MNTITNKRVMIVDDDQRNIFALKAVLTAKGFECITAQDVAECMELLEVNKQVDVVLLDMMMPGTDGYEAIKLIKQLYGSITLPVIAVTAQAMAGDRQKCLDAGADDYISKPINVDIMIEKLSEHVKA